jgi:hypothetical protein
MKKAAILALILLSATGCIAQTEDIFYVKQFPGVTVGQRVSTAMLSCNANTAIPCLLVLDPSLATYTQGTMPSLCPQCFLMDYRQGSSFPGLTISGANLTRPLSVGPTTLGQTEGSSNDWRTSGYPVIDLRSKGLVGDGQIVKTCSIALGKPLLTCSGASFVSADVGKAIGISGAGASEAYLNTTIASVQSATQISLAVSASATVVSNGVIWYGTDNTAAWCSAVGCTTATTPNMYGSRQPGRVFILPYGIYIVSGTVYLHNNDNLVNPNGQAATELVLLNGTPNVELMCLSGNASNGANTCTVDSNGTQQNAVEGIMFQTPEASQNCIDAGSAAGGISGFSIHNNWFECGTGIVVNGNIGHIWSNTFDSSTTNSIFVKGNGINYGNNPTHSILIDDNFCFANSFSCLQVDGASSVQFKDNLVLYAKQYGVFVNSRGSKKTYRLEIEGNTFVTSQSSSNYSSTQNHIFFNTPVIDSSIRNNKFRLSRQFDIQLESSGITNLAIESNEFTDANGTSVFVGNVGPELTIRDNKFKNIGNYAVDSSTAAILQNNFCTAPFQVAGLPSNVFDQGCFRFTGARSSGVIAQGNVTDSISVSAVVIHGSVTSSITSGNRSASIYDTYLFNGSGNFKSWSERIINPAGPTLITTPVYSLSISGNTVIPPTATGNTGNSTGKVELVLSGTTGTITGTTLSASCDSGTATVTGAAIGHPVVVSSTTGADIGGAFNLRGSVTAMNIVTVYICGTGTPPSLAYNVTVF